MSISWTPSATWILNESTYGVLAVARKVLHAATTDDVQPGAILAAEAFGATLPIAQETRELIEAVCTGWKSSKLLKDVKCAISWSRHDAATRLSESRAGICFLALTSTLMTLVDSTHAARCLEYLIRASASSSERESSPTLYQLKDLVDALRPKVSNTGFVQRVSEAEERLASVINRRHPCGILMPADVQHPGPKQIQAIVEAARIIERIGEISDEETSDFERWIVVKSAGCHSWLYAFLRWIFGVPPQVIDANGTELIAGEASNRIQLVMVPTEAFKRPSDRAGKLVEVEIWRKLDGVPQLWKPWRVSEIPKDCQIFLTIEAFGEHLARPETLTDRSKQRAIHQAVGYILHRLHVSHNKGSYPDHHDELKVHYWPILPERPKIEKVFLMLFKNAATEFLKPKAEYWYDKVEDLPLWKNLNSEECSMLTEVTCKLTATIISLALFDVISLHNVKVHGSKVMDIWGKIPYSQILEDLCNVAGDLGCERPNLSSNFLRLSVLELLGHDVQYNSKPLAMSGYGQVVYCSFLDYPKIRKTSVGGVTCFPGELLYKDRKMNSITGTKMGVSGFKKMEHQVLKPQNLLTAGKVDWLVHEEPKSLKLTLSLPTGNDTTNAVDPAMVLAHSPANLYILDCPHRFDAELAKPDQAAHFVTGGFDEVSHDGIVQIAAVAGDEGQRFWSYAYAMGAFQTVVVRERACLACSLRVCRRAGVGILIL